MRRLACQLSLGVVSLVTLVMGPSWHALASPQDAFSPVPDSATKSDLDEPYDDHADDADPSSVTSQVLADDVAAPPAADIRARRRTAVSLGIGRVKPWLGAGLEVGRLVQPNLLYGLYAGGGSFNIYGNKVGDKSYDMTLQSRSAGGVARYYFQKFQILAVEASAGVATWNGHIAPRGSDDTIANQQEKLTDSFHATGLVFGLAGNMNWVWENGFFLDWTVAGLQFAKVLRKDFSRDDGAVNHVVLHDIEALRIYGIVDLKLGYYF